MMSVSGTVAVAVKGVSIEQGRYGIQTKSPRNTDLRLLEHHHRHRNQMMTGCKHLHSNYELINAVRKQKTIINILQLL